MRKRKRRMCWRCCQNDGVDRTRIWRPGWFFSRDLAAVPLFRRTEVRMRSLERRNIQYKPCRFEFRYTKRQRVPAPWPKAVSRDTCRLMWDILACCVFAGWSPIIRQGTLKKNSGWKWMNQNFLVKFIRILVEIIEILVYTIFLIKSTRILIFYQNNYINQNSSYYLN